MDLFSLEQHCYHNLCAVLRHWEKQTSLIDFGVVIVAVDNLGGDVLDKLTHLSSPDSPLSEEEFASLEEEYKVVRRKFTMNFNLFYQDYVKENEELRCYMEHKCAGDAYWVSLFYHMKEIHIPAESTREAVRDLYSRALGVEKAQLDSFIQKTGQERFW